MTSAHESTGTPAKGALAEALLAVGSARGAWLDAATLVLRSDPLVVGVWLVGSLGRGDGDCFSDVDVIVAVDAPVPLTLVTDPFGGLNLPGIVLYTRPKPRNAPASGVYLAVCLELAGLPVLVDLYVWPATTAAISAGATVLYQRGEMRRSPLGLLALLAQYPAEDSTGADPDDPATVLFLIQLAAKYHARGDHLRRAGIYRQLQIPDCDTTLGLRHLLETQPRHARLDRAAVAVRRLLDLADMHWRAVPRRQGPARPTRFVDECGPGVG